VRSTLSCVDGVAMDNGRGVNIFIFLVCSTRQHLYNNYLAAHTLILNTTECRF